MSQATRTLVTVFLRGGADGLSLVPPHGDPHYRRHRPTLALEPPGVSEHSCLDLDGFFGLHPAMAPMMDSWREGRLALVQAVGSDDETRSHFEAQDQLERGGASGQSPAGGWLARYLLELGGGGAMDALAFGPTLPESLRGAPGAVAIGSLADLPLLGERGGSFSDQLRRLHGTHDELGLAGRAALEAMARLAELTPMATSARYPDGSLGVGLADVARLVRAGIGPRVACLDSHGWDTHFVQGGARGLLADRAGELASALAAFDEDLGSARDDVVVVVMTEFGRRAQQNASLGTDHGHASVMMVLGSKIRGGQVHGRWPGLDDEQLVGPGDLAVTSDYRSVLREVLLVSGGISDSFEAPPLGLIG